MNDELESIYSFSLFKGIIISFYGAMRETMKNEVTITSFWVENETLELLNMNQE
jgi:hypothetical protein